MKKMIFLLIFLFQTLISLSEEPLSGICCQDIRVTYEFTENCCILLNIANPTCHLPLAHTIIQKYDSQTNQFINEYIDSTSSNISTILCANEGETQIVYRVKIAQGIDYNTPYCTPDNWVEGWTQFTDTVSLDNCCDCPSSKRDWLVYSLHKSRECPDNGCQVNLLDIDIPSEYSCYTNYQLKWNDGSSISQMMSIANDPIYTISKCIPNGISLILRVYLYKNGESNPDSACTILKIFQCREDILSIDTTENICTPDCFNNEWETPLWKRVEVPQGSNCFVNVLYTYRTACPPENYQDLQVLLIRTNGCPTNLTNKQIYQETVYGLVKLNPMGFKPNLVYPGCDTLWRLIKTDCMRNLYVYNLPSFTNPIGHLSVVYLPCDFGVCCVQKYTVCRDSTDDVTLTPTGTLIGNNSNDCQYIEDMPLPLFGPNGEFLGPMLSPEICYSTCDWVTISHHGDLIVPGKASSMEYEDLKLSSNILRIACNEEKKCDVKIDYFNLQGNIMHSQSLVLSTSENNIDITSYVSQQGIYIFRIYINNNLYQTGKFVK